MNNLTSIDYVKLARHSSYSMFISYTKQDDILSKLSINKLDILYDFYYTLSLNRINMLKNKNNRFDILDAITLDNIYSFIISCCYSSHNLHDLVKIFVDDLKIDINYQNNLGDNFLITDIKNMLSVDRHAYLYYKKKKTDNMSRYMKIFLDNNLDINQINKENHDLIYYIQKLDEKYETNYLQIISEYDDINFIKSAID